MDYPAKGDNRLVHSTTCRPRLILRVGWQVIATKFAAGPVTHRRLPEKTPFLRGRKPGGLSNLYESSAWKPPSSHPTHTREIEKNVKSPITLAESVKDHNQPKVVERIAQLPESARLSAATFHCGELRVDAPCCVVCGLLVSKPVKSTTSLLLGVAPRWLAYHLRLGTEQSIFTNCLQRLRAKLGLSLPRFPLFPGWQSSQWPGNPWFSIQSNMRSATNNG
jgi:hypothetical protein